MVKLNWLEEGAINIIIAVIIIFFVRFMQTLHGFDSYPTWVWVVVWFILYLGISSIIIKLIKGKDIEKPQQDKTFGNWWKKQKTYEKVLIILALIVLLMTLLGLLGIGV